MKRWALAVVLLGVVASTVIVPLASRATRGARLVSERPGAPSTKFDRRQSAALFVGVREFASAVPVPFAVDDAIDLAYAFALDRRSRLVPARRVVLVISSRYPVKPESRDRLHALREAGADIRERADTATVRAALRDQSARAGRDGMLIVAIAAHGLLRDGNGYILGASSLVRDPATMLSTNEVFETIATSAAQRSLVFIDACRERLNGGTRSVLASAMTAAPPLDRGIARRRGQAIFYAAAPGQVAYDDFEARNGVFTKAVIAGIHCAAPKVRDSVTADTLAGYVEHHVQAWIREHRDPNIGSATQWSIEGEARDMPLAQCVRTSVEGPDIATAAGTTVSAFSKQKKLLWQRDTGSELTGAEAVDLDADGWRDVVFSTRDGIGALDDGGAPLWSAREPMTLTMFATGDLFRQRTREVVALWNAGRFSRLAIYAPDGKRIDVLDRARRFDRIAIAQPTTRFMPRIIATSGNMVFAFHPRKLSAEKPLWSGRVVPRGDPIESLQIVDGNGDGKRDIVLTTASGAKVFLDITGHALSSRSRVHFERMGRGRR